MLTPYLPLSEPKTPGDHKRTKVDLKETPVVGHKGEINSRRSLLCLACTGGAPAFSALLGESLHIVPEPHFEIV